MHFACSAPHDNPLDPENPDYSYACIAGTVRAARYPHAPISGATLNWQPGPALTLSAADGSFSFGRADIRSGRLLCSHADYFADSLEVTLQSGKTAAADFLLNQKPSLDNFSLYSIVLNRYPALRTYQIGIACAINDQDNDIESVALENDLLGVSNLLTYNTSEKSWQKICTAAELHLTSIQEVTGRDFGIRVVDRDGHTLIIGTSAVRRIITDEVSFSEPVNYQAVVAQPTFRWQKPSPGFDFTYKVEIYAADLIPLKIWEKNGIAAEETSIMIDHLLDPGDYFWVIWCVDEFGNCARSKPASFTVRSTN